MSNQRQSSTTAIANDWLRRSSHTNSAFSQVTNPEPAHSQGADPKHTPSQFTGPEPASSQVTEPGPAPCEVDYRTTQQSQKNQSSVPIDRNCVPYFGKFPKQALRSIKKLFKQVASPVNTYSFDIFYSWSLGFCNNSPYNLWAISRLILQCWFNKKTFLLCEEVMVT